MGIGPRSTGYMPPTTAHFAYLLAYLVATGQPSTYLGRRDPALDRVSTSSLNNATTDQKDHLPVSVYSTYPMTTRFAGPGLGCQYVCILGWEPLDPASPEHALLAVCSHYLSLSLLLRPDRLVGNPRSRFMNKFGLVVV